MDFAFTPDQLALRDAVRRWCDAELPAHERGNVERDDVAAQRRAGMAQLGLMGLALPVAFGGSGLGAVETMVVAREFGRALAGSGFVANAVLAAPLLAQACTPTQAAAWLGDVACGRRRVALALQEEGSRDGMLPVATTATHHADGWHLQGHKTLVLGGDAADLLLVVARTAGAARDETGLSIFAVDADAPGVTLRAFRLLDNRDAAHVTLDGVVAAADRIVGIEGAAHPLLTAALARAAAASCAESAGALDSLLDATCEHLNTRRQFGAPLARFQALRHAVADMAIALEQVESMACVAAMAVESADRHERDRLVSAAKALVAQLGRRSAFAAIQLHGGMGMTDECRVGHHAKRLLANGLLFGDAQHHLQRFASLQPHEPSSGDIACPASTSAVAAC